MIVNRRLWNRFNGTNTLTYVVYKINQEEKDALKNAGLKLEEAELKFDNASAELEDRLSFCKDIYESYVRASLKSLQKSRKNVTDICEKHEGVSSSIDEISESHRKYDENVKAILSRIDAHDAHNNCIQCIQLSNEDNLPECYLNYIDAAVEDLRCAALVNPALEVFSKTIYSIYNKVQKSQIVYSNAFNELEEAKKVCEKFEEKY
jgi:DNA repair ATPase RecN